VRFSYGRQQPSFKYAAKHFLQSNEAFCVVIRCIESPSAVDHLTSTVMLCSGGLFPGESGGQTRPPLFS
jgi:hypothetical protein